MKWCDLLRHSMRDLTRGHGGTLWFVLALLLGTPTSALATSKTAVFRPPEGFVQAAGDAPQSGRWERQIRREGYALSRCLSSNQALKFRAHFTIDDVGLVDAVRLEKSPLKAKEANCIKGLLGTIRYAAPKQAHKVVATLRFVEAFPHQVPVEGPEVCGLLYRQVNEQATRMVKNQTPCSRNDQCTRFAGMLGCGMNARANPKLEASIKGLKKRFHEQGCRMTRQVACGGISGATRERFNGGTSGLFCVAGKCTDYRPPQSHTDCAAWMTRMLNGDPIDRMVMETGRSCVDPKRCCLVSVDEQRSCMPQEKPCEP